MCDLRTLGSLTCVCTALALSMVAGCTEPGTGGDPWEQMGQVAAIAVSPASGSVFQETLEVTLFSETEGAAIYYTTDPNENPSRTDPNSTEYTGPIELAHTTTIRARAYKEGMIPTAAIEVTFTRQSLEQAAAPSLSPAGGIFTDSVQVILATSEAQGTIRYTLDGSDPNGSSSLYEQPILITETTTLKARTFKEEMSPSDVVSATYTKNETGQAERPAFDPDSRTFTDSINVTLSTQMIAATIRYTTDGSDPQAASTEYTTSIQITQTTTVRARTFVSGLTESEVASATYTRVEPKTFEFNLKWGEAGSEDGQFLGPSGQAVDSTGNVYVADQFNNRIQKFTDQGIFVDKWGKEEDGLPVEGQGEGEFNRPTAVAFDADGNLYVVDTGNHRIQKLDSEGTFLTEWGAFGDDDGQFRGPRAAAVDSNGNVYIADSGNQRIQKFDAEGTFLLAWGGPGSADGKLDNPLGVAVDSNGRVYVADGNNDRIQVFSINGTFLTKWGGTGSAEGQFDLPAALAVDASDNVYVVDGNNDRIQVFTWDGTFLSTFGTSGDGDGQFAGPVGIGVADSGAVYVSDLANGRVQKFVEAP